MRSSLRRRSADTGAVKDKPSQVSWLAESEKAALQEQLDREQQGIKAVRNYGEAFRSRNVILLCAQYFAWSIGVYGFVLWLPSIIRSGGENMGMVEVGWLSSVPYLAATIAMIVVSWASDKLQNRKLFVWPLLLIGEPWLYFVFEIIVMTSLFVYMRHCHEAVCAQLYYKYAAK